MKIDYNKFGLLVGLELHQQLDTKQKLFCNCPPILCTKNPDYVFVRRLRPTQSELGQIDPAALFEFQRGRTIAYQGYKDTTCLVEADSGFTNKLLLAYTKNHPIHLIVTLQK